MIKIKKDSILNATEKIIAHQVNCVGVAGGLAYDIFDKWPEAENDYNQICERLSEGAIGLCQMTGQTKDGHIIANLFGQIYPGRNTDPVALMKAFRMLAQMAKDLKADVAIPWRIGCGIGGGDWDEISNIIEEEMQDVEVTLYKI